MNQIKKRQHYVWRNYLRAWSDPNDLIPALIKDEKKVIATNLMNVAQEKYYYSLEEFSIEEENILKEHMLNFSNEFTENIFKDYFDIFTSYSKIKRFLKTNNIPQEKKEEFKNRLEFLKSNTMEDFHTDFENFGQRLIKIKKFEDISFLHDRESQMQVYIFICLQYVRTKKMQNNFRKKLKNHEMIKPDFYNILSIVIATGMACGLIFTKSTKIVFIENISKTDFITSDQPIMNLKSWDKDLRGNTKTLELFYPINPKIALKIHYEGGLEFEHLKIKKIRLTTLIR